MEKKEIDKIAERLTNDSALRKTLEEEANAIHELLATSVLNESNNSTFDKIEIISLFFPGNKIELNTYSLAESIWKGKPRKPPEGPTGGGTLDGPGGGGGGCLAIGTIIATPDGPRPIESLKPKDAVLTQMGEKQILEIRRYDRDGVVQVDLGDDIFIYCSAEHPFISPDGKSIRAIDLASEKGLVIDEKGTGLAVNITEMKGRFEVYELILDCEGVYIFAGDKKVGVGPTKEL